VDQKTEASSPSPVSPVALPIDAPEFTIIRAGGTLRIPLTTIGGTKHTTINVTTTHVDRNEHLPVTAIDTSHRPTTPAAGTTKSA